MMRGFLVALAVIAGLGAAPIHAARDPAPAGPSLTRADAECAAGRLPADFGATFDVTMTEEASSQDYRRVRDTLSAAVDGCMAERKLDEGFRVVLYQYALGSYGTQRGAALLARAGIPADAIDLALDLGEGRSNPERTGLSTRDKGRISDELKRRKVDVERIGKAGWYMIDQYAALSTIYWTARKQLSF